MSKKVRITSKKKSFRGKGSEKAQICVTLSQTAFVSEKWGYF